jgi:hypothetical protein
MRLSRLVLAFAVCAAVVGAGCFSSSPSSGNEAAGPPPDPLSLPAQCDASRRAVAHGPGGVEATRPDILAQAPIACYAVTGFISREPTMGISAAGTVFHYPAMTGNNAFPTGLAVSRDGGASWELSLPGVAGQATHRVSTDPYFYHDPVTDRIFADDLTGVNCSVFSWSDDEGATWEHSYSGCLETDHQTIFAGVPVSSQTTGYPHVIYRCAINAIAVASASTMSTCQKSLDGGRVWGPPTAPAYVTPVEALPEVCNGALGHGVVDAVGRVYLPRGFCGEPFLAISDDEGGSWTRMRVAENGIQGHEAGVGVDPAGNIYYSWVAEDGLPYLAYSRDGGGSWSEPIMFGPPGLTHSVFAQLYVGGVGKVASAYMGTTFNGSDVETYDGYLTISHDVLAEDPVFYSAPVNDPREPLMVGGCCGGLQDFMDVVIGPDGTPWGAYVDDCLGEGFECEEDPDEPLDTHRQGAVGWFWGAASLWGEDDANGPYP